jgi:hypothetical protein
MGGKELSRRRAEFGRILGAPSEAKKIVLEKPSNVQPPGII